MLYFKIFFITILLCFTPDSWQKIETSIFISNQEVSENLSPPAEKKIKKKKSRKKRKFNRNKTEQHPRPGFIVMIIGGLILAGLAVYWGIEIVLWSNTLSAGCSLYGLGGLIVGALAWMGYIILVFAALALIISGAILLNYYLKKDRIPKNSNSWQQKDKQNYIR